MHTCIAHSTCTSTIRHTDFTKEDDNDETLAVQIIANANGTLIKEARTDAEFGWISIAGDC
jgi:hypothetical protein